MNRGIFFRGIFFVFVEYLCKRCPNIKTKNIENYSSVLAIVNHRNWLDDSPPLSPKSLPMVDIICGVEEGLRKVNDASAVSTARSKVAGVLKIARPPKRNIDKEEEQALKELREDKHIVILKADKGNCTVIMDRPGYDQKINALLNDNCITQKMSITLYTNFCWIIRLNRINIIGYIEEKLLCLDSMGYRKSIE